jgi:hypothetical protein
MAKERMDKTYSSDALHRFDFSLSQHLGLPVLNLGFSGEDNNGVYHSIYDSYDNFIRL